MKRKLLLSLALIFGALGLSQVKADAYTTTDLTADGWKEVTSLENTQLSQYVYVFYSVEGENLMLAQGRVTGYQQDRLTGVYCTAGDPMENPQMVWMIDYSETFQYGLRNLSNPSLYMQSRGEGKDGKVNVGSWNIQFEWERSQSQWTRFKLAYSDNSWTIENKAAKNIDDTDPYHDMYIGPWDQDASCFSDGKAVAGNKTGSYVGHFKLYRMLRSKYRARFLDGWTLVSSDDITQENVANNYYIIADKDCEYFIGLAQGYKNGSSYKSLYYQVPNNPVEDLSQVWMFEYNTGNKFAMRSLSYIDYLLQTEDGNSHLWRTHDQTAPCEWTDIAFSYNTTDNYWTIQNVKFSNCYLGPWGNVASSLLPAANGGYEIAGNRGSADAGLGKFFIYSISKSAFQEKYKISAGMKGDITWMVTNPSCNGATGWTNVTSSPKLAESWRNNCYNYYVERISDATVSQTLGSMPAGTYKVVAALRADTDRKITVGLNNATGTVFTGTGNNNTSVSQINMNGVQMPFTSAAGYQSKVSSRGWQWGSATTTLDSEGELTIKFIMEGNSWMSVDDVKLYYSPKGSEDFVTYTEGSTLENSGKTVTADIVVSNPNVILSSNEAIITAADVQANNNLVDGTVANLVLYDPYEFSADDDFTANTAKLYRSIAADAFATVCAPFAITGGANGTFYQPASLTDGTLNFGTEASPAAGKAYLYKASSAVTAFTGSGDVKASPIDNGEGVVMKGTYSNIDAVPTDDYVLSGTNLYKVNSKVGLRPFRAYFTVPSGEMLSARISLNFDEDATGIDVLETESTNDNMGMKDGKYFQNGKIVIVKNGVKYSTNGQIVK